MANGSIRIQAPGVNQGPLRSTGGDDPDDPRSALRQRVREMANPGNMETPTSGHIDTSHNSHSNVGEVLIMEDGTQVPINYNSNE